MKLLIGFLLTVVLSLGSGLASAIELTWTLPTTNADGTPLTDLSFSNVYICAPTGPCNKSVAAFDSSHSIPNNTRTLDGWPGPTQFFVTAVDTDGNESAESNVCYFDPANPATYGGVCASGPTPTVSIPAPPSGMFIQ